MRATETEASAAPSPVDRTGKSSSAVKLLVPGKPEARYLVFGVRHSAHGNNVSFLVPAFSSSTAPTGLEPLQQAPNRV